MWQFYCNFRKPNFFTVIYTEKPFHISSWHSQENKNGKNKKLAMSFYLFYILWICLGNKNHMCIQYIRGRKINKTLYFNYTINNLCCVTIKSPFYSISLLKTSVQTICLYLTSLIKKFSYNLLWDCCVLLVDVMNFQLTLCRNHA